MRPFEGSGLALPETAASAFINESPRKGHRPPPRLGVPVGDYGAVQAVPDEPFPVLVVEQGYGGAAHKAAVSGGEAPQAAVGVSPRLLPRGPPL